MSYSFITRTSSEVAQPQQGLHMHMHYIHAPQKSANSGVKLRMHASGNTLGEPREFTWCSSLLRLNRVSAVQYCYSRDSFRRDLARVIISIVYDISILACLYFNFKVKSCPKYVMVKHD